ncbi:hypothetical protein C2E20_4123 [Micractinium conductrix]|uniref:Uncharacterized protein n=1 Tax=Micractinium conductrix TaxID=554055 RepID=A0A2P6VE83_9CHLO|nr:hypothetical protein C2E20_4123 [Micractinium conductrix]|eukprot:PSC72403.1 hypothetical protein C2E20_4123 [Micractinium conductrix]
MATSLEQLGGRLGLHCGPSELSASLNPNDYCYGAPSEAQLQRLLCQRIAPLDAVAGAQAACAALQGAAQPAAVAPQAKPAGAGMAEDLFGLHLDLDDDCLRLLLGEDADETSGPCASAAASGGKGGPRAADGPSQKSSATGERGATAAAPAGDAEAASAGEPAGGVHAAHAEQHEDDDIAMLFGEGHRPSAALELDLHLLGGATHHQLDAHSGDTSGDSPNKRAKSCSPASPSGRFPALGLSLSMDYEAAAESINLQLLGGQRKSAAYSFGCELSLPLLSPAVEFAPVLGIDTPDSPDSLASGSDAVKPVAPQMLECHDSAGKRKRATMQH